MTFISLDYAIFLLLTFVIYWLIPKPLWRLIVILISSITFYSLQTIPINDDSILVFIIQTSYILLLLISITFNFYLALNIGEPLEWHIANAQWNRRRTIFLWLGIIFNIVLLLGFKYIPFILNSIALFVDLPEITNTAKWLKSYIIAPLGLSFFCFESIAYLIDVYRGAPTAGSLLHFVSYKLFFPKLISGPITRYHHFLNELKNLQFPTLDRVTEGLWLIAVGAIKKRLLADHLGIFVDLTFSNLQRAGSMDLWLATLAYGFQLYLDFNGYVDIARGSAILLGFNLPENFNFPYFSTNISDFWRRWHITLGDWLRNYLYFPLGGSRVSLIRTCFNLLIVMVIAGIWHGAAWGFIVWGTCHGLALVMHRLTDVLSQRCFLKYLWQSLPGIILAWFLTQSMVFITWIFFRLPNLPDSLWCIQHLFSHPADAQFIQKVYVETMNLGRNEIALCLLALFLAMSLNYGCQQGLKLQINWPIKLILVPLCLYAVWLLAPAGGLPYIYFDF